MPRATIPRECVPEGHTPQSRHEEKLRIALSFVAVFGVTTVKLFDTALGVRCSNFTYTMCRKRLLKATHIPGLGFGLVSLTAKGRKLAELHIGRTVAPRRMDSFSTHMLSHDLMTQVALLDSLSGIAERSGCSIDLAEFLRHARESRDLTHLEKWSRPDVLYIDPRSNAGYAIELERSQKSTDDLVKNKMHRLCRFRAIAGLSSLAIEFAVRGGSRTLDRYRRCWDTVLEEAHRDGIAADERIRCRFRTVGDYPGMR